MAELFLGAVVGVLVEKLVSSDFMNDVARSAGILSETAEWKRTLVRIQALLVDAGKKQITNGSVKLWLDDLQHLAYDMDNILDDLEYEALRRQLNKGSDHASSNKVWKIIPTCCSNFTPPKVVYGHSMSPKIDEITKRLRDLLDQKKDLCLTDNVERSVGTSRRVEQTSLVDESEEFVGREKDKVALLQLLEKPFDKNVNVVAIVGMGGMGKTTLVNHLYKEVKEQYELDAWFCVSDDFDNFNISKSIYKDLGGVDQSFGDLNQVQKALEAKLSQKKFLIVLDDVWSEDGENWKVFQRPFVGGAPGSKIIVTTRKEKVASMMRCAEFYSLEPLLDDEALSLFAQHALGKPNVGLDEARRELGVGIAKKCGRLPLALRILGGMLWGKQDVKEWEELLHSEVWDLQDGNDILPALRLSYYDLYPHLKRVFAYCSLFPKDYMFNKDELILLWMAEGFLNEKVGKKTMESLGHYYFDELKARSFFEHSTYDKSKYKMHDLINDLATSVAGEFFFRANDEMENSSRVKFRHISFISAESGQQQKFERLHKASSLRTCLALTIRENLFRSTFKAKFVVDLFPRLQLLRVLSLAHSVGFNEVPQSIGCLNHIRYLNFSNTSITSLPEQVTKLYNLQSLLLHDCRYLFTLPHSFEKLINLRHLDINNTPNLKKLPLGIGELKNLQTLSKAIIDDVDGFKISMLKGISNLHGRFYIEGLHNVRSEMDAQEAKLHQKKGLDDLDMEWSEADYGSQNEMVAYKVLKELRPHDKLKEMQISFYNGTKFPRWVGDPSFDQLTVLSLRACRSCIRLPTLGQLVSLRELFVRGMHGVETLDSEFLSPNNSHQGIPFPSLEVLEFDDMSGWKSWSTKGVDNNRTDGSFPRIREISIRGCPKLDNLSIGSMPSLQSLDVEGCTKSVLQTMVGVSSSIRRLTMQSITGLFQLDKEVIEHLGAVEVLDINGCKELEILWDPESETSKILVNLRKLHVVSCEKLSSLGGKEVNIGVQLKSLRDVYIQDCKRLGSYNCQNGIEGLSVISSMTSLTFELPSTLKLLSLGCNILEESRFHNHSLSSIESLTIHCCKGWLSNGRLVLPHPARPKLWSLNEGCFTHLTSLEISSCGHIESIPENGFGFLQQLCLRYLTISYCSNLKSIPHKHFQSLASLEVLEIVDCPSMDDTFPCKSWPPNLSSLEIGNLKKPMSKWGFQNFPTSLSKLEVWGENSGLVSFAKEEDVMNISNNTSSFFLPPSLTSLTIHHFEDLELLSEGLQHLNRLHSLVIWSCPKLRDLPKTLLPSLPRLNVYHCPELEKKCRDKKGDYWPIISEIDSCNIK